MKYRAMYSMPSSQFLMTLGLVISRTAQRQFLANNCIRYVICHSVKALCGPDGVFLPVAF